jgi:hypothetical protein
MKHYLCLISIGLFLSTWLLSGQAKKPTLMVVPSDTWCNSHGYMEQYNNQGSVRLIPNYQIAVQTSSELMAVISKLNILMADRGFPLKDLSQVLKSINTTNVENSLLASKASRAAVAESPLDRVKRSAKADIVMELDWSVNTVGPKQSVTYNLRGLDAYTGKQVAGAEGTGPQSFSVELPVLLEEAVLMNMDNFTAQLQNHFDDMLQNGREATIDILIFDDASGIDLEKEYGGDELGEIIESWINDNAMNHRFNKSDGSENFILFEQVRIPLYDDQGRAASTESFVRELRKFLRDKYNLQTKIVPRGLGRAALVIGDK